MKYPPEACLGIRHCPCKGHDTIRINTINGYFLSYRDKGIRYTGVTAFEVSRTIPVADNNAFLRLCAAPSRTVNSGQPGAPRERISYTQTLVQGLLMARRVIARDLLVRRQGRG